MASKDTKTYQNRLIELKADEARYQEESNAKRRKTKAGQDVSEARTPKGKRAGGEDSPQATKKRKGPKLVVKDEEEVTNNKVHRTHPYDREADEVMAFGRNTHQVLHDMDRVLAVYESEDPAGLSVDTFLAWMGK